MAKRSGKFYNKNEKEVMKLLGLKPTAASGAGWLEKEDGQSENLICQLKSTDANSITINLLDIEKLEYQAQVTNKIPIFAIQFLKNISDIDMGTYLVVRASDLKQIESYLANPYKPMDNNIPFHLKESEHPSKTNIIKSSSKAKDSYWEEQEKKWKNKK